MLLTLLYSWKRYQNFYWKKKITSTPHKKLLTVPRLQLLGLIYDVWHMVVVTLMPLTCLDNWNWWVWEWTIEYVISKPLISSLRVVHTIPANILWRISTRSTIHLTSIYNCFWPTPDMIVIHMIPTADLQGIGKSCKRSYSCKTSCPRITASVITITFDTFLWHECNNGPKVETQMQSFHKEDKGQNGKWHTFWAFVLIFPQLWLHFDITLVKRYISF